MWHISTVFVGDRVKRLQARNDFAGLEHLNLKFVVGHFGNLFRKVFGRRRRCVSSDFGKLDVMRHLISGEDCAIAGEATAATAAPVAETFKKSRRFI